MKKLIVLLLALLLVAGAACAQEEENRILAVDSAYTGLADMNPQFKGGESSERGCLGLQPAKTADGGFADAYMLFAVEADTAGVYRLTVRYAAKAKEGQIRCADLLIGEERIALPIEGQTDWNVYADASVDVFLPAGTTSVSLVNVEGFDNSTYKAINVDYLAWELLAPAADEGRILALDAHYADLNDMNAQFKGGESSEKGVLGLQPAKKGDGTFAEGHITFVVTVETPGAYTVTVRYAAKAKEGQTRCADLTVNGGERIHLPIVGQADWNVYVDASVDVELNAGANVLTLLNAEGFDNSALKAINVDYLAWALKAE